MISFVLETVLERGVTRAEGKFPAKRANTTKGDLLLRKTREILTRK